MRIGVRNLLTRGLVPAGVWGGKAVGISPTEGFKLRRQMAAAVRKESVSSSLFMEVNVLELEEDLPTMATLFWAKGAWMGRWRREQQKARRKQIFEVRTCRSGHV